MNADILYIDDDKFASTVVEKHLAGNGYRVTTAVDGLSGLKLFQQQRYDLILCDYAMPGMDGLAVLDEMKKSGSLPAFVFLTGKGDENIAVKAMKSGASDYLVKDEEGGYLNTLSIVVEKALERKRGEELHEEAIVQLKQSEQRYRDIFDTNPAIKLVVDPDNGSIYDCNAAALDFYGYTKEEFLDKKLFDINVVPQELVQQKIEQVKSGEQLYHQLQHRLKSGEVRDVEAYTGPLTIGDKTYIHAIIHDITGMIAAQEELEISETKFRQMFERTRDGICILQTDGTVVEWSYGAEAITQLKLDDVKGKHIVNILFREHAGLTNEYLQEDFEQDFKRVATGESEYEEREEEILFAPDGTVRYVDLKIFPITLPGESRLCILIHNVTEQVKTRQEVSAREQKFRTLFESIADAVFILNQRTGILTEVNSSACDLYGYEHDEFIGLNVLELSAEPELTKQAIRAPKEYIPLRYHKKKNGEIFPVEITTSAVRMSETEVIVCTVREISERVSLQEELERSVALMEVVNDTVVDAILVTDTTGKILSFNKRFIQTWGIPQDDTFAPDDVEHIASVFQNPPQIDRISLSLQKVGASKTDAYGIVEIQPAQEYEVHASPFFVRDKEAGTVWSFRNLTQRKHAEEQLQISQARLKAIFDNAAVGIALINRQGRFVQFNEQLSTMLGYSDSELKQLRKEDISYGEDKKQAKNRLQQLFEQGHRGYRIEKRFVRKDGDIFWADLSVRPILNSSGEVEAAISVVADISDKKRFENELQRINNDLQSRNEELNAFAHSVAHDLKNPVSVVQGLAELLKSDLYAYEPDELYEVISKMKDAGDSMESIIDSLMLLSRVRDESIEILPVNINESIRRALAQLQQQIDETSAVIELPDDLPDCRGYAPWVDLVWVNYISNALKYSGDNPHIKISADQPTKHEITYYVEDSGPGISVDDIGRLFAPYQRLTRMQKGHGLGLSIVKRIVERLNGRVGVSNSESGGAVFYFALPKMNDNLNNVSASEETPGE